MQRQCPFIPKWTWGPGPITCRSSFPLSLHNSDLSSPQSVRPTYETLIILSWTWEQRSPAWSSIESPVSNPHTMCPACCRVTVVVQNCAYLTETRSLCADSALSRSLSPQHPHAMHIFEGRDWAVGVLCGLTGYWTVYTTQQQLTWCLRIVWCTIRA